MDTSLPKIVTTDKSRLFFNQYQYCARFIVHDCTILHNSNPEFIHREIEWRNRFRADAKRITQQQSKLLQDFAAAFKTINQDYKKVLQWNTIFIYTNDLIVVQQLSKVKKPLGPILQANVVFPDNVLLRNNPQYKFRTYLRAKKLDSDEIQSMIDYFDLHQQDLSLSPSFKAFLNRQQQKLLARSWTYDYFFIDHNSDTWVTMLNLKFPGFVKRTLPFQAK